MARNPKWWRLYRRSDRQTPAYERRLGWQWHYAVLKGRWLDDVLHGSIRHPRA